MLEKKNKVYRKHIHHMPRSAAASALKVTYFASFTIKQLRLTAGCSTL